MTIRGTDAILPAMSESTKTRYGLTAILLHWVMAALLVAQFALGTVMSDLEDQRRAFELIQLHKSIGFLLLALVLLRLGWRLLSPPPPLPREIPASIRGLAAMVHGALYGLMLALPLTGWALVSASILAIPTLVFGILLVPHLPLRVSEASEAFWHGLHYWLGLFGAALVALHVLAALGHQLVAHDAVLARMLPSGRLRR